MLLSYTLWSSVESGSKEAGAIRASPSLFWSSCASFDRSLFTLWVLFSEKGTGWTSKVSPKPTPSASVCVSHYLGVRTMLSSPGDPGSILGTCTSVGCWTSKQSCVRMGRGWNLLCWGWGLQQGEFLTGVTDGERQVMDNAITQKVGSMDPNRSDGWVCWHKAGRSRIEDRRV